MPNHVTTICTVSGDAEQLGNFRQLLFSEVGENDGEQPEMFDFDKLIPQPASIKATESGSEADNGAALILLSAANPFSSEHGFHPAQWDHIRSSVPEAGSRIPDIAKAYLAKNPHCEAAGRAKMLALLETGHASWYDWNVDNWGTKWGAYRVEITDDGEPFVFRFETAWSFPEPIFVALIERFPGLTFDCTTFDEGWNFAGKGQFGATVVEPFATCDATDELYEAVYGEPPEHEEEG